MKAGRELDARIAEEVMEWDVYRKGEVVYCEAPILLRSSVKDGFAAEDIWRCGNNRYSPFSLPHYSTQIADAWLVVEKMWNIGCWRVDIRRMDNGYLVDFDDMRDTYSASATAAPLAICLAALAVVERRE